MHVGGLMGIESTKVTPPPYSLPSGGWVPPVPTRIPYQGGYTQCFILQPISVRTGS